MHFGDFDPRLVVKPREAEICKKCKFAGKNPNSSFCEKYTKDSFEPKPKNIFFGKGEGKCPKFEEKNN